MYKTFLAYKWTFTYDFDHTWTIIYHNDVVKPSYAKDNSSNIDRMPDHLSEAQ